MNDKEELEQLRREKDRDIRFKASTMRGFVLALCVGWLYGYIVGMDSIEKRSSMIIIVLIAFAMGALTAYIGRFRAEYNTKSL
ncbi:MAG TPA: hypothetical protein VMW10_07860 [Alphaproteobacteria bacterium]|nr:hypothetical protein [Alphaproteobacteria bacterium]